MAKLLALGLPASCIRYLAGYPGPRDVRSRALTPDWFHRTKKAPPKRGFLLSAAGV
jgi:hypothetical protein